MTVSIQVQVIAAKMSSAHITTLSSKCTNVPDDDWNAGDILVYGM